MINGVTQIVMTKADILDGLAELKVCNSYHINGEEKNYVPFQMNRLNIKPVYKNFEGWNQVISSLDSYEKMPEKMKIYINYINEYLKIPVNFISNGPGREQIVAV